MRVFVVGVRKHLVVAVHFGSSSTLSVPALVRVLLSDTDVLSVSKPSPLSALNTGSEKLIGNTFKELKLFTNRRCM